MNHEESQELAYVEIVKIITEPSGYRLPKTVTRDLSRQRTELSSFALQGARMSMPYFVNPRLNFTFQGPDKKYPPLSGFDLLAKTGNAYEARRNDPQGKWKQQAYGSLPDDKDSQPPTLQDAEILDNSVPIPAN